MQLTEKDLAAHPELAAKIEAALAGQQGDVAHVNCGDDREGNGLLPGSASTPPVSPPLSRVAKRAQREAAPEPEPAEPLPHWMRATAWSMSALIAICAAWIAWIVWMPHPSPRSTANQTAAAAPAASAKPAQQPATPAPAQSAPADQQGPAGAAPLPTTDGQSVEQSVQQSRRTEAQSPSQPASQPTQPSTAPQGDQGSPTLLQVSGWACDPGTGGQNCGPLIDDGQGHLVRVLPAPGVTCDINGRCNPPNCPPILQGRVTLVGNRIRVQVGVSGPAGFTQTPALIDTGAGITILPKQVLDAAGYRPVGSGSPLYGVSDTPITAYPYKVLSPYVKDGDRWAQFSLSGASITIYGVAGGSFATEGLIGPDLLRAARLTVQGNAWALSLPCGN